MNRSLIRRVVRNLTVIPLRNLISFFAGLKEKMLFIRQFFYFMKNNRRFGSINIYPVFNEKNQFPFDRHYFYHPVWAFRVIYEEIKPQKHVDISSVLSFASDLSVVVPVEYYEYNIPDITLENFSVGKVDLKKLPFENDSIFSLSCMHVVEHIGLGRYGDDIDIDGDIKAASELKRVLAYGGHLLFVVPVAESPRLEFNAHRVYTFDMIEKMFHDLELKEFALIPDNGPLQRNAEKEVCNGQNYSCGCFHFVKKSSPI